LRFSCCRLAFPVTRIRLQRTAAVVVFSPRPRKSSLICIKRAAKKWLSAEAFPQDFELEPAIFHFGEFACDLA
jgi:hypothetical protein